MGCFPIAEPLVNTVFQQSHLAARDNTVVTNVIEYTGWVKMRVVCMLQLWLVGSGNPKLPAVMKSQE